MKRILTIIALSLSVLLGISINTQAQAAKKTAVEQRCTHHTLKNQGIEREYWLYIPESISEQAPLLIYLHGYGGSAIKGSAKLLDEADRQGFAVCFPQGANDGRKSCWNVGYPFQKDYQINDVDFICELKTIIQTDNNLSTENAFLSGMSNGGEMCYLMAMKRPGEFNAIASLAGLTLVDMDKNYTSPVPFMEIHGTEDHTSEWGGDPFNEGGWGAYLSVPAAVSHLVSANDCVGEVVTHFPTRRNPVILYEYKNGKPAWEGGPDTEVWLYKIIGGGHSTGVDDIDTYGEMWRFFKNYLK